MTRAIDAASGNRPLVVLANLSGYDGSPESMRNLQLEYGAEIGGAIVNFRGRIVYCAIWRNHGGAFFVLSKALNSNMTVIVIEGPTPRPLAAPRLHLSRSPSEGDTRTARSPALKPLDEPSAADRSGDRCRRDWAGHRTLRHVRGEIGEVAAEYLCIHEIERTVSVGSVDAAIPATR